MAKLISSDQYSVIIGAGKTGQSIARYLSSKGLRYCVFDTRHHEHLAAPFSQIDARVRVYLGDIDPDILLCANELIMSPGVSISQPIFKHAKEQGVSIVGDIELFFKEAKGLKIGITGSNGKTTLTTMLALVAQKTGANVAVGGNIGVPALDLLTTNADIYILELSSFQLETVKQPQLDVAAVLNVTPDHMDRHATFMDYVTTKQKIYWGAKHVVYNIDDVLTIPPVANNVKRYGFSLEDKREKHESYYFYDQENQKICHNANVIFDQKLMQLRGVHNVKNAMALLAICEAANIPREYAIQTLTTFTGLEHRCEWIASFSGVTFVNDSKATNVGATISALEGLSGEFDSIVLIAGGDAKQADFTHLASVIQKNVDALVLFGLDAERIESSVNGSVNTHRVDSLNKAVITAYDLSLAIGAQKGARLVLLSPACASLDMFKNYEVRGHCFRDAVKALAS